MINHMTNRLREKEIEGFESRSRGAQQAQVRSDYADTIAAALFDGIGCILVDGAGRGGILRFPCGGAWAVLRRYRRGGLLRALMRDKYLLDNRPLRELQLHVRLERMGLPVPEALGAVWERRGPMYCGAIVTRELEAVDLRRFLNENPGHAADVLRETGALIRRMHDAGVYHADLQLANILAADRTLHLIDFDKARICGSLSPCQRSRNLLRLRRSFERNGFPAALFDSVREGYGAIRIPRWLDAAYRLRSAFSGKILGRNTPRER